MRGVRQLLRERNNLVKAKTQAINRLHNLLDRYGLNSKATARHLSNVKNSKRGERLQENKLRMTGRQEIMVSDLCGVKFEFSCSSRNCDLPLMNG